MTLFPMTIILQLSRLIGPLVLFARVSPSSRRQPGAGWWWRARRPHTHSTNRDSVKARHFSSLCSHGDSLWLAFWLLLKLLWVVLPPRLGDPAPLVEELANDHNIVAEHVLGHPHPVDLDVWREVFSTF